MLKLNSRPKQIYVIISLCNQHLNIKQLTLEFVTQLYNLNKSCDFMWLRQFDFIVKEMGLKSSLGLRPTFHNNTKRFAFKSVLVLFSSILTLLCSSRAFDSLSTYSNPPKPFWQSLFLTLSPPFNSYLYSAVCIHAHNS